MPGYFAPSSPWTDFGNGIGAAGDSMARLAMNLATMKAQRQQQMLDMAYRQAQLGQEQERIGLERQAQDRRAPLIEAQTDEAKANTEHIGAETTKTKFDTKDKETRAQMADNVRLLMGALKSPMAANILRDPQSGPALVAALRSAGVVPEGEFSTTNEQIPDLLKAALPAVLAGEAMQTPGSAERMMAPVQLAPSRVPVNLLTGEQGQPAPPVPAFRGFGRGGILNERTGEVTQESQPYPTPANSQLSPNAALGALKSDMWSEIAAQNPGIAALVTNTLMRAAGPQMQMPVPAGPTNTPVAPVAPQPVTQGKQLDADTAKAFLAQAGGDKDKARQMARAAGYNF